MSLQAYIDDSVEAGRVLVLAGYVSTSDRWSQFALDWRELIEMRPAWSRFKMAEVAQVRSRWERASWLHRATERHSLAHLAVAIDIVALKRVVEQLGLPANLANPYHIGFMCMIDFTAQYQHELGFLDPIDFIFDERGEREVIRSGFQLFTQTCDPRFQGQLGAAPRFESDDRFAPLQAADMLAWHVRRHWLKTGSITQSDVVFLWDHNRKIPGYTFQMNYDDLLKNLLAKKVTAHPPLDLRCGGLTRA